MSFICEAFECACRHHMRHTMGRGGCNKSHISLSAMHVNTVGARKDILRSQAKGSEIAIVEMDEIQQEMD